MRIYDPHDHSPTLGLRLRYFFVTLQIHPPYQLRGTDKGQLTSFLCSYPGATLSMVAVYSKRMGFQAFPHNLRDP